MTTDTQDQVTVTRLLNAPREAVWRACSEVEALKHWWGMPDDCVMLSCTVDFRVGGVLHIGVKQSGNPEMWFKCVYTEISPGERVAMVQHLSDKAGNEHDSANWPPTTITLVLEDVGGKTRLTATHSGLAGGLATADNFAQGWSETFDRLERVLG